MYLVIQISHLIMPVCLENLKSDILLPETMEKIVSPATFELCYGRTGSAVKGAHDPDRECDCGHNLRAGPLIIGSLSPLNMGLIFQTPKQP